MTFMFCCFWPSLSGSLPAPSRSSGSGSSPSSGSDSAFDPGSPPGSCRSRRSRRGRLAGSRRRRCRRLGRRGWRLPRPGTGTVRGGAAGGRKAPVWSANRPRTRPSRPAGGGGPRRRCRPQGSNPDRPAPATGSSPDRISKSKARRCGGTAAAARRCPAGKGGGGDPEISGITVSSPGWPHKDHPGEAESTSLPSFHSRLISYIFYSQILGK